MSDRLHYFPSRPNITPRPTGMLCYHPTPQPSSPGPSSLELRDHQGQGSARYVRGSYTLLPGYNIQQVNGLLPNDDSSGFLLAIPSETPLPGCCTARISPRSPVAHEAGPSSARTETTRTAGNATTLSDFEVAREAQEIELAIRNSLMDGRRSATNVLREQGYHGNAPADRVTASSQSLRSFLDMYNVHRQGVVAENHQDPEPRSVLPRPSMHMAACTLCHGHGAIRRDAAIADGMPVCENCCDEMIRAEQSRVERAERGRRVRFI